MVARPFKTVFGALILSAALAACGSASTPNAAPSSAGSIAPPSTTAPTSSTATSAPTTFDSTLRPSGGALVPARDRPGHGLTLRPEAESYRTA